MPFRKGMTLGKTPKNKIDDSGAPIIEFDRLRGGVDPRRAPEKQATVRRMSASVCNMIRKLKSGQYRLYSRKKKPETGKRRNLGTFHTLEQARQHEREVQFFKKH